MTVAAGPAVAQSSIGLGGRASGALEAGDLVTADGRFYDCYRLRANRNAWVSISLNSRRFDGFIELGEGGSCDFPRPTAADDDSAGYSNARLDARLRSGSYSIRVTSYGAGETGDYSLQVDRGAAPRSDAPDPFRNGISPPALPVEQHDWVRPQTPEMRYQWDAMCMAANWVTRHERVNGPPTVPGQVEEETAMLSAALAESARLAGHTEDDARGAWGTWTGAAMSLSHDRLIVPHPVTISLQRTCVKQLRAAGWPQSDGASPTNAL